MNTMRRPGSEAIAAKGRLRAHKWLLLRRTSQLLVLALFLAGPWVGFWVIKGSLASSVLLDTVPLTDPYLLLQSLLAGQGIALTALLGSGLVVIFYIAVGGRAYCSWICPMNIITDLAAWLRHRFNLGPGFSLPRNSRYWVLAATLAVAVLGATLAWELINPVGILYRGAVFGMGFGWAIVAAVFAFDLLVSRRGWCGHLCPTGAFYSLLGTTSLIRVRAGNRHLCTECMDCYAVCPEPQVIAPAMKEDGKGPVILSANCTNCGRCVDICSQQVFSFSTRFHNSENNRFETTGTRS